MSWKVEDVMVLWMLNTPQTIPMCILLKEVRRAKFQMDMTPKWTISPKLGAKFIPMFILTFIPISPKLGAQIQVQGSSDKRV